MEKEYLIHNIDCTDNPEDQHQTLDITLSNLEIAGQDITADVGIDTFVNGMPTSSNKYEDVSLTGAGGGGGMPTANVKFNVTVNGSPIEETLTYAETTANEQINDDMYLNMMYGNAIVDSIYTLLLAGEAEITQISFYTEDNRYGWDTSKTCTINSGDARIDNDTHNLYISGDCELTIDTELD